MEIESARVPALMTNPLMEAVENVALEPSTVASTEAPSLVSETVMAFCSPAIPLQVRIPLVSVGVTLSMIRSSNASRPRKCAEGLMNLRAR